MCIYQHQSDIISTFWFLVLSMKMSIFSIIMSIIKAINDAIITRNDIISTFFTISVTSFINNQLWKLIAIVTWSMQSYTSMNTLLLPSVKSLLSFHFLLFSLSVPLCVSSFPTYMYINYINSYNYWCLSGLSLN